MATRRSGTPGPGGYWLPRPSRTALAATWATAAGPSVSGKPWPRLIEPVRTASADISAKIVVPNSASRRLSGGRALRELEVMSVILRRSSGVPQLTFGDEHLRRHPGH